MRAAVAASVRSAVGSAPSRRARLARDRFELLQRGLAEHLLVFARGPGHSDGMPSASRYQLLQPVVQTVFGRSAFISALKASVTSARGLAGAVTPSRSISA